VRSARADASVLTKTSALLSTGAADLADAVGRLQSDAKASARERQKLREELAVLQGAALARDVAVENGLRLVVQEWKDRDREYVRLLASRTVSAAPSTVVIFSAKDADPARIFLARGSDLDFNCGQIVREALARLGLRGGGSADLAQGDVPAEQQPMLVASVREAIRGAVGAR
jgi:alanyl-tRNA synthetase